MEIAVAQLKRLVAHNVGNQMREEALALSVRELQPQADVAAIILNSYLGGMARTGKPYAFFHESDTSLNEVNVFIAEIFANEDNFLTSSIKIARHLYAKSTHPNIAAGDLLVTLFDGVVINNAEVRAVGLFKIENREKFLSISNDDGALALSGHEGIDPKDLQKGALIIEGNHQIYALERGSGKTTYWMDDFLKIKPYATPKTTAAFVGQMVKKTIAKIDDPQEVEKYRADFDALLAEEGSTINQLSSINEKYIGREKSSEISEAITEKTGLSPSPAIVMEPKLAQRAAKNAFKRIAISHGVDLVLSGKSSTKNIRKEYSSESRMLTIFINLEDE